ncbi:MAG: cyclic nucleotide-binding domain-containing protein, partial [Deltaproteobacteria bacterium]|nr:cyclic nucleotide-binding domain-containing protein [Deltaproteobacteria bacterium]
VTTLALAIRHANATPHANTSRSVALLGDLCRVRGRERLRRAINILRADHPTLDPVRLAGQLVSGNPDDRKAASEALHAELDRIATEIVGAAEELWKPAANQASSAALIALQEDPAPHIRAISAHMLSRFDDDEAREAATRALEDDDGLVREAAAYALGVRGRLRRELMARALKDEDPRVRRAAVSAMSPQEKDPELAVARAEVAQTAGAFATFDANSRIESLTTLEKMALLGRVPLFAKLEPADLEQASLLAEERSFGAGQALCTEGETGDEVFVLIDGQVEVYTGSEASKRVLGKPGAGACIGEMSVVDSSPRSATVIAIAATRTLVLPADEFRHLITSRPAVGQAVIDVLVGRLRRAIASS